jgi:hypothetical protein
MRSLNAGGLSEHSTLSELSEHAKKLESVSRRRARVRVSDGRCDSESSSRCKYFHKCCIEVNSFEILFAVK